MSCGYDSSIELATPENDSLLAGLSLPPTPGRFDELHRGHSPCTGQKIDCVEEILRKWLIEAAAVHAGSYWQLVID